MSPPSPARKKRPAAAGLPADPEAGAIAADLVGLLHGNAPIDDFAARLADLEALPAGLAQTNGLTELARLAMALRNRLEQPEHREPALPAVLESAPDPAGRLDFA